MINVPALLLAFALAFGGSGDVGGYVPDLPDSAMPTSVQTGQPTATKEQDDVLLSLLREMDFPDVTCDGIWEYEICTPDGNAYQINETDSWIWKNSAAESPLTEGLLNAIRLTGYYRERNIHPDSILQDALNLTLTLEGVTPVGATLVFTQGGSDPQIADLMTGEDYAMQLQGSDGEWTECSIAERFWNDVAYSIHESAETRFHIDWSHTYGSLSPGYYRIEKQVMNFRGIGDYDRHIYYAEFEIQ